MRYLVTVEVQKYSLQTVAVEAASVVEAGLSAVAVIDAMHANVTKVDVVQVVEDSKPDHNTLERGTGYIARLL